MISNQCFVDKNKIKETEADAEDAKLDSELSMKIENVKPNIVAADETAPTQTTSTESVEEEDDLPF